MCKRSKPDPLAKVLLERYHMNALSLPGNRVKCGSVYIRDRHGVTAPGELGDLLEPAIELPPPAHEARLPQLQGVWSNKVSFNVGVNLLQAALAALGAAGIVDKIKAAANRSNARSISFCFAAPERDALSPTALGVALEGCSFRSVSPWVRDGNRYYAAAAVMRSKSISIKAHDERDAAIDLKAGLASVAEGEAEGSVQHGESHELTYHGKPVGFAVELYELSWDDGAGRLVFSTPKGPIPVDGLDRETPDPVYIGEDDDFIVEVTDG
jgi:hypothetical protein